VEGIGEPLQFLDGDSPAPRLYPAERGLVKTDPLRELSLTPALLLSQAGNRLGDVFLMLILHQFRHLHISC
jgi:hypothetical protein